jgi:hypothetical protein
MSGQKSLQGRARKHDIVGHQDVGPQLAAVLLGMVIRLPVETLILPDKIVAYETVGSIVTVAQNPAMRMKPRDDCRQALTSYNFKVL